MQCIERGSGKVPWCIVHSNCHNQYHLHHTIHTVSARFDSSVFGKKPHPLGLGCILLLRPSTTSYIIVLLLYRMLACYACCTLPTRTPREMAQSPSAKAGLQSRCASGLWKYVQNAASSQSNLLPFWGNEKIFQLEWCQIKQCCDPE